MTSDADFQAYVRVIEQQVDEIMHLKAQINATTDVVAQARKAVHWWDQTCDRYPTLVALWVAPLNLALRRLDKESQ